MQQTKFRFVDLFAGIGGMRIPFDALGGQCVFSSEWDKYAQQTYAANFGETPHGDITAIKEKEIPAHDLLLAGFPCQAFSHAGLKRGFEDTRGTMFFEIARILKHHRPALLLLENVRGFTHHDSHRTYNRVIEALQDLGYSVHAQLLNARDFGLPQNRSRIYIVGLNKKKITDHGTFQFPAPTMEPTNVASILQRRVNPKYIISRRLWESHQARKKRNEADGKGFGYSLFAGNSTYTRTLTARYNKDGAEILISRGNGRNPRKITPREAARLQGFRDKFTIPVSDAQAYKQFGNSVAVPVVAAIAKVMVRYLKYRRH